MTKQEVPHENSPLTEIRLKLRKGDPSQVTETIRHYASIRICPVCRELSRSHESMCPVQSVTDYNYFL